MTYIEKSLADDEEVLAVAKFHWTYRARMWAALLFLGVFLIGIVIFARMFIWMKTTEIAVTDRRAVIKKGWITRRTEELSLTSIEEVSVRQSVLGRLFGFGRLAIAGTGEADIRTPDIADPVAFRTALSDARTRFLPPKVPVEINLQN